MFNSILVTGCGGDIGQGICRILKMSDVARKVVGCDIHDDHAGSLLFDCIEKIVRADEPSYFPRLNEMLSRHRIDLIIPASEAELAAFMKHGICRKYMGIPVITAGENVIRISLDKLETVSFLKEHGLNHPWTCLAGENDPQQIPCVLKMRSGQGSKNFLRIMEEHLVGYYKKNRPLDLWQELLLPDEQEYTCGVYRTRTGDIRTIIFRRKLSGGLTGSGITVNSESIKQYLEKIAVALDLWGSINVQLRYTERGPVLFEINPRFSSTVVFRHYLGFQDLLWSLKELKGITPEPYVKVKEGIRIYRGACEYIIQEQSR